VMTKSDALNPAFSEVDLKEARATGYIKAS
jgi:hypothetical protein